MDNYPASASSNPVQGAQAVLNRPGVRRGVNVWYAESVPLPSGAAGRGGGGGQGRGKESELRCATEETPYPSSSLRKGDGRRSERDQSGA